MDNEPKSSKKWLLFSNHVFFLVSQYWIREENKKQNEKNNALQVASTVFVRTYLGFTIKKVVVPIRNKI